MCPPPPAVADRPRPCIGTGAAEEDLDNMAWLSCRAPQLAACLRRFVAESATLEPRALTQGVRHARRLHYRSELTRAAESSLAMGYLADWMMARALRPRVQRALDEDALLGQFSALDDDSSPTWLEILTQRAARDLRTWSGTARRTALRPPDPRVEAPTCPQPAAR